MQTSGEAYREAALALARRYDFEEGHALQDEHLALLLFDETARLGLHDLNHVAARESIPGPREILIIAAILHDIGYWYGYASHHKHAYKMIMESGLPGVPSREQKIIALVARYHRGKQPDAARHQSFADLPEDDRLLVRQLSSILRFADGLDRTHTHAVERLECALEGNTLVVKLSPGVGNAAERWAGQKKARFFEEVFGVVVTLS